MVQPGLINLDFADVRAVMDEMGKAMMGTGEADGEDRATQAAEKAIANPLLDEISLRGAKGVLINITGGYDLTLFELDEAANRIREEVDPEANIIVGSTLDTSMEGAMRVSVVATGIDASEVQQDTPMPRRRMVGAAPAEVETAAEPVAEEVPEPAFQPQAPAARQPAALDEVATAAASVHELAEFDPLQHKAPPSESDSDLFAQADVPQPVYRPEARPEPAAPAAAATEPAAEQPQAGKPTKETLQRLQAAVASTRSLTAQRASAAAPSAPEATEKRGFGINSLINRMTGQAGETGAAAPVRKPAYEAEVADPEQDKVEIPAFLRRQAN